MKIFHAGKWWSGRGCNTPAERAELFGEAGHHSPDRDAAYNAELVDRYCRGAPLTKESTRQARLLIKRAALAANN